MKMRGGINPKINTGKSTMHDGKDTNEKAIQVTEHFAETSGIHGIGHIIGRSKLGGTIWSVICLASLAMLIYQVAQAIQGYYEYPVSTWVQSDESILRVKDKLSYPAVTICNEAALAKNVDFMFNETYFLNHNVSVALRLLHEALVEFMTLQRNGTIDDTEPFFDNISYEGNIINFKTVVRSIPLKEKQLLGFKLEDMLIRCRYDSSPCSVNDFWKFPNYKYGNCYTFNAQVPGKNKTRIADRGGTESGLDLELMVRQFDYVHVHTLSAGIRLVVHKPTTMPFPEGQGISLSPGFNTGISITKEVIESVPPPYTQCRQDNGWGEPENIFYDLLPGLKYDQEACLMSHYQRRVQEMCDCYDNDYPKPKDATGEMDPKCNIILKDTFTCMDSVWRSFFDASLFGNHCLPQCHMTDYSLSASQAFWPATESMKYVSTKVEKKFPEFANRSVNMTCEEKLNFLRNNVLRVQVYYKDTTYQLSVTKPKYSTSDLLSSIGSQISLWLGMSIISGFEIVEYIIQMWLLLCKKSAKRKLTTAPKQYK